jgi:hypothetical protein
MLVRIRFADEETLNLGLGFLIDRFSGDVFQSGELIVPEEELAALTRENLSFTLLGKITPQERAAVLRAARLAASKE